MKNLEKNKQEEISKVLEIILEIGKKYIVPEYVIVYGEYLKNEIENINLVKEGDILVEYQTTMNIFIITRKTAQEKLLTAVREIHSVIKNTRDIKSPVKILVENINSFNNSIKQRRYFYLDIINSGVTIYDSGKIKISKSVQISKKSIKGIQKTDFNHMYEIATEFIKDYRNAYNRKSYKLSLFYLHQASEFLLSCYLLIKVGYKPKTHDLEILYSQVKKETREFNNWFDLKTEEYYFELLRNSYISSRYNKDYLVKNRDILFLEIKVFYLREIVRKECVKLIIK